MPSILLFGVTGLVGSHLVLALKDAYPELPVTVYLRNSSIDEYLTQAAGVKQIVHGTFDDSEKISALAKEHDVVINVGSSWDLKLSEAIVAGLRQRPDSVKTTLIHMSGTGNFVDTSSVNGRHNPNAKIWNDDNPEDMKLVNPKMLNGGPDTIVLNAGKEGKIGTYIVFPSGLYGSSAGPIRALGVIQLLMQLKAKELGFVPYIGSGTTTFNSMHVNAISPFTLQMLALALREPTPQGSVYERCYIIGGKEMPWKEASDAFARAFHKKGLVPLPEAKSVALEEAGEGELPLLMASDMRFISERAEKLGYKNEEVSLVEFLDQGVETF